MRAGGRFRVVVVVVALSAAACDGGGPHATRITVMVSGDAAEIDAYRAVVDAFNDSQEGIHADLISLPDRDELTLRLGTSIAGGQPPDLFLMNYRYYGQFASKGALEPVARYLEGATAFTAEDFFPTALAPFRWRGEQMCLPQNVSSLVVYYNADLFEAAGLRPPQDGWTWEAMVRAARRMTRDEDGDGSVDIYGLGTEPEIVRLAPFVWSGGGRLFDHPSAPTRFSLDARAVLVMERFFDLRSVHGVTPTDEEAEAEDFESRFLNGRLAMLLESRRVVPTFRTIRAFDWDVARLPLLDDPVSILHSDAYCMTAASDAKDGAWRFMEFALGPEGQRITAAAGRTVPSLRSVASSDSFLDPGAEPSNARVFLDQIENLQALPSISIWPEIEDTVNGLLEEAYYAGVPAAEVAIEIETQTRHLFARAEG